MKEAAITLPLDVVERLLVMAQAAQTPWQPPFNQLEFVEAIKLVEREIEQVRRANSALHPSCSLPKPV